MKSLRAMRDGLRPRRRCSTGAASAGSKGWSRSSTPTNARGEPWLLDLARKLRAQGVDYEALYRRRGHDRCRRRGAASGSGPSTSSTPAMATKAAALSWRLDQRPGDRGVRRRDARDPRPPPRPGDRHVHRRRVPGRHATRCRAPNCARSSSSCTRSSTCSRCSATRSSATASSAWPSTPCRRRSRRTCGRTSTTSRSTRCSAPINPEHLWTTNGPDSNLFGLEPNFGCCTANMHQGWPKFAAHLWMRTPDDGLVAAAYAPCRRRVPRRAASPVAVALETDYPFRETLDDHRRRARAAGAFPLLLRVPAWAQGATRARRRRHRREPLTPGTLHRVEREWTGETTLDAALPDAAEVDVALQRGRRGRARAARLLARDRRAVDARQRRQAAPRAAARRLRGAPDDALELRAACSTRRRPGARPALRGAARRRAALLARGRGRAARGATGRRLPRWKLVQRLGRRDRRWRTPPGPTRPPRTRGRSRRSRSFPTAARTSASRSSPGSTSRPPAARAAPHQLDAL